MDVGDLDADPLAQLAAWMEEARAAGETMPEAFCLATASSEGLPSARYVLMRGLDHGVVFYTDYESAKAKDLAGNARAAGAFRFLRPVHRQLRVEGPVERTTAAESDRYWATRPAGSRRSAVASHQSTVVASREVLERAVDALGDTAPARPDRWGGYRIVPSAVELWEEGSFRLHDRLRYLREEGRWRVERLSP